MMIPTLFLDIDGVLNRCHINHFQLEIDKVVLLGRIVDETNCRIVLISNWRLWSGKLKELHSILETQALFIHSQTPILTNTIPGSNIIEGRPRYEEIQAWLDEHPNTGNYVILDDLGDFGPHEAHHVKTKSDIGLTLEIVEEVTNRLNLPLTNV